jgi:LytR cell envelope-related transcriptional attenuator
LSGAGILLAAAGVAAVVFRPQAPRLPPPSVPSYEVPGVRQALKLEVLNGTGRSGLARVVTRQLRQHGFDVVFYGETPAPVAVSQVIARRVEAGAARPVAEALHVDSVSVRRDATRRVDVSVWLGKDFRPRPELHP